MAVKVLLKISINTVIGSILIFPDKFETKSQSLAAFG